MEQIREGDLVMLKSGGPKMTVQTIGQYVVDGRVVAGATCVWHEDGRQGPITRVQAFPLTSLKLLSR